MISIFSLSCLPYDVMSLLIRHISHVFSLHLPPILLIPFPEHLLGDCAIGQLNQDGCVSSEPVSVSQRRDCDMLGDKH